MVRKQLIGVAITLTCTLFMLLGCQNSSASAPSSVATTAETDTIAIPIDDTDNAVASEESASGTSDANQTDAAEGSLENQENLGASAPEDAPMNAVDAKLELLPITAQGDNIVEIPQFTTESGESTKSLDELNEETKELQELYHEANQSDGNEWVEIRTYTEEDAHYLQATTTYITYPNYATEGDLMTLCYVKDTDTVITNVDALKMTGLAGDQLSILTGRAFDEAGYDGSLMATDMQGFHINENGLVDIIYMKLRVDYEGADPAYSFYAFYPADLKISKLSFTAK